MLIKTLVRGSLNVNRHKIVRVKRTCMGIEVYIDRNNRLRLPGSSGQPGALGESLGLAQ